MNKYFLKIPYATSLTPSALLSRIYLESKFFRPFVILVAGLLYGGDPAFRKMLKLLISRRTKVNFNGQMWQDLWVISKLGSKASFFVDIGAAYPIKYSNTYLLQSEFGWSGILVEPNPQLARSLQNTRSSQLVSVWDVAVAPTSGTAELVEYGPLSNLKGIGRADIYQHLRDKKLSSGGTTFIVQTYSPADLLEKAAVNSQIGLLSVDVEGLDLEILQSFPFEKFNVELVCVEHNYDRIVQAELDKLMSAKGFSRECRRWSGIDAWYAQN